MQFRLNYQGEMKHALIICVILLAGMMLSPLISHTKLQWLSCMITQHPLWYPLYVGNFHGWILVWNTIFLLLLMFCYIWFWAFFILDGPTLCLHFWLKFFPNSIRAFEILVYLSGIEGLIGLKYKGCVCSFLKMVSNFLEALLSRLHCYIFLNNGMHNHDAFGSIMSFNGFWAFPQVLIYFLKSHVLLIIALLK